MKLGKYTIPSDVRLAGSDDNLCRGNGTNGLDANFESAVKMFLDSDEFGGTGYHVNMGYSGYVSSASADSWARGGNPYFGQQSSRFAFGWGLGWEIDTITLDYHRGALSSSSDLKKFISAMKDAGVGDFGVTVKYFDTGGTGEVSKLYFAPSQVSRESSATELSYQGENVSAVAAGASSSTVSGSSGVSMAAVSYFFANQFGGAVDASMSSWLQGERALANDVDLWSYVLKAVNASMRCCASDPDGNFIAWYPDYYGKSGKTPQVVIEDVELLDLTITQSDKEFYSHVFCPGVDVSGNELDMLFTQGVVSIEGDLAATASAVAEQSSVDAVSDAVSPLLAELINIPEGEEWRYTPKELYRRYGARPAKTKSLPFSSGGKLIEDSNENMDSEDGGSAPEHILPYLYALYEFMYHWAQQYQATITITFMPELFPGMRIKVKSLDIEFYVQGVSHSMNYTSGFTTTVNAICPVGSLVSGMVKSSSAEGE